MISITKVNRDFQAFGQLWICENSIRESPAGDVWNLWKELMKESNLFYPLEEILRSSIYI